MPVPSTALGCARPVSNHAPPAGVFVRFTAKADGDFTPVYPDAAEPATSADAERADAERTHAERAHGGRRRAVYPGIWAWNRQVHGSSVRVVAGHGGDGRENGDNGHDGDALVTRAGDVALSVVTADCAPVAFWSSAGDVIGMAHAGWRGLEAGVLERTVAAMVSIGAVEVSASLGPCIHSCCYEFGRERSAFEFRFGPGVTAQTSWGTPALDVPAVVDAVLGPLCVRVDRTESVCTACSQDHFSFRSRRDSQRQVSLIWREG